MCFSIFGESGLMLLAKMGRNAAASALPTDATCCSRPATSADGAALPPADGVNTGMSRKVK